MKMYKIVCFFIALTFLLCTCNDPVFFAISQEIKPIEPRINGAPSNIINYNGRMYVAAGEKLYSYTYNKTDKPDEPWSIETPPGGVIVKIESTKDNFYALCTTDTNNNGKTVIKRFDKDSSSWQEIDGIHNNYKKIQNIFTANDILFILVTHLTTSENIYYDILYLDNSGESKVLPTINNTIKNNFVNGIVYSAKTGAYYLSSENGVYKIDNLTGSAVLLKYFNEEGKEVEVNFTGIINLKDNGGDTLVISRKGELYTVADSIVNTGVSMKNMSTGVLAVWTDPYSLTRLLLVGRQESLSYSVSYGYRYGYMELELDSYGIKNGCTFSEPGKNSNGNNSVSTIVEYERYQSTLGKQPVNCLFQTPSDIDPDMILFASTQKNGVWSCRKRDNNPYKYWNAEGEDEPEKYAAKSVN